MAIKEIEQNTDLLSDDIIRLEEAKDALESAVDAMFDAVKNLDTMWNGPANAAFNAQFQADYQTCREMNRTLGLLIEKLRNARSEYDKCESEVESLIREIRI
ncbi:MAG: WXG100 family type VII secretion target [Eubacteriales bacterium]|nr:WXG100 family type VII secretion target [Eubacteriales bacterium]